MTYTITTDAGSQIIDASDIDAAARAYAASEGWDGVASADDLAERIEEAGGWVTVSDERSIVLRLGAR